MCSTALEDGQPNCLVIFFLDVAFLAVSSSSTRALSPANDSADPRVRKNSKQREEELELIEQLRKVSAARSQDVDILVNALCAPRKICPCVLDRFHWTGRVHSKQKLSGTVQSEWFFHMDAVVFTLGFVVDKVSFRFCKINYADSCFCFWNECLLAFFLISLCTCKELLWKLPHCLSFNPFFKTPLCCKAHRKADGVQRLLPVMLTA